MKRLIILVAFIASVSYGQDFKRVANKNEQFGQAVKKYALIWNQADTSWYTITDLGEPTDSLQTFIRRGKYTRNGPSAGSGSSDTTGWEMATKPDLVRWTTVKHYGATGDGTTDDLAAVNAALSSTYDVVVFERGTYAVGATITVPSNKRLIIDQGAKVYLKNSSDTLLMTNAHWSAGDSNIVVEGGTWDGNGVNQIDLVGTGDDPDTYHGTSIRFQHVKGLTMTGMTIKDPQWFGIHLGRVTNFTIRDIVFDYRLSGGDGLHISGLCNNGYISNLRDPYGARRDDFLAIMTNDAPKFNITPGEIHNIVVDGIIAEPTGASSTFKSGVDFLDTGAGIHDITVSNVVGEFSYAGVQFMNFGLAEPTASKIYNIYLNKIDITVPDNSAMGPVIIRTNVKNLTIDGFMCRPFGATSIEPIQITDAAIDDLVLNNVIIVDSTTSGVTAAITLGDTSHIGNLTVSNWHQKRVGTAAPAILLKVDRSSVGTIRASNVIVENSASSGVFSFWTNGRVNDLSISNSTFLNCNNLVSVNVENVGTARLNNLSLSNVNYTPYSGTTEVIKLLYNIEDTVNIKTSNLNLSGFETSPILRYPSGVKVRLNGFDFKVNPTILAPKVDDMVISTTAGPVTWSGSEWIGLGAPVIDTITNVLTIINPTVPEDTTNAKIFNGGTIRLGLSPNPTVGLRAGVTKGYAPYFQGVASSSSTTPLYLQPVGNSVRIGTYNNPVTDSMLYVDDGAHIHGGLKVDQSISASGGTSDDWNTAYGWGNHAAAGYLLGLEPRAPLATTGAGDISIPQAAHGTDGFLSGTDWDTFNGKISSQWTTYGGNIVDPSGNVGIGTGTSPTHKVSVVTSKATNTAGVNVVQSDWNKNRTTVAQATDTSTVNISMTDGGKPMVNMVNNTGGYVLTLDSLGRVGIGTSSPLSALHLYSSSTPIFYLDANGVNPAMIFRRDGAAPTAGTVIGRVGATGNTGSGLLTTNKALIGLNADESWNATSNGTNMTFSTTTNGTTTLSERMRLDNAGNVGIGTSAPTAKVQIAGKKSVPFAVSTDADGSLGDSTAIYIDAKGQIGIGTTSPTKAMSFATGKHVQCDLYYLDNGYLSKLALNLQNAGGVATMGNMATNANSATAIYSKGAEAIRIDAGQRVGIGTTSILNIAQKLDVNGSSNHRDTIWCRSGVTYSYFKPGDALLTTSSSVTIKDSITEITTPSDLFTKVLTVSPKRYNFKPAAFRQYKKLSDVPDSTQADSVRRKLSLKERRDLLKDDSLKAQKLAQRKVKGFLAEEFNGAFGDPASKEINYTDIIAVLWKTNQALIRKVEDLEARVAKLEKK